MKIKIDDKILSIPPYISTKWSNVAALHMKGTMLVVTLNDHESINIPGLDAEVIDLVFSHHTSYLENDSDKQKDEHPKRNNAFLFGAPLEGLDTGFKINVNSMENFGSAMQHNPEQSGAPDLPPEILEKIAAISKIVQPDDVNQLPKPEPHCNCMHCQISRAILKGADSKEDTVIEVSSEEEVTVDDLTFQQWEVQQAGNQLFTVINKLDTHEQYSVFLGKPVGCTCGKDACEHIVAVLKS
jgi:hypothetical protein